MNWELIGFVFLGLFSPGPNVILLTTSGARFGFRATLPHLFGVVLGVGITAGLTGLGIAVLTAQTPLLKTVFGIASGIWILWMAYGLWNSDPTTSTRRSRPMTFGEAVLFQWVNPKVWAVAFAATAYLSDASPVAKGMALGATFSTLNLFVCLFWTYSGQLLGRILNNPFIWQAFMRVMAICLVAFSILVFIDL